VTPEDQADDEAKMRPRVSCSRCGEAIEVDATFCNGCGTRVDVRVASASVTTARTVEPGSDETTAARSERIESAHEVTIIRGRLSRALPVTILIVVSVALAVLVGLALTRSSRQPPRTGDTGGTTITAPSTMVSLQAPGPPN
jgi:uncharacterized membrane protein YvbJ